MKCELCDREISAGAESDHHLIPKSCGGRNGPSVILHEVCHKQIHALFNVKILSKHYNTMKELKNHIDIKRFVKWIRKKDINFNVKAKRSFGGVKQYV